MSITQVPKSNGPTLQCAPAFQIRINGLLIGEYPTQDEADEAMARIDATHAWVNRHATAPTAPTAGA